MRNNTTRPNYIAEYYEGMLADLNKQIERLVRKLDEAQLLRADIENELHKAKMQ